MKKEIIYFFLMLLAIMAGLLIWEAAPAIAEKIGIATRWVDMVAYSMSLPGIIFSGLFNEAHQARKNAQL